MSPEQALGEDDVDARADVWALGVMLYEGLSGVLPTRADNLGRVIKAVAMMPIAPIESRVPGLPPDLVELVGRMLSKPRDERPRAMDEVRVALARHESASLAARPDLDVQLSSGAVVPGLDASEIAAFAPSTSSRDAAPRSRAAGAMFAAVATAVLLGATGLASLVGSGRGTRASVAPTAMQSSALGAAPAVASPAPAAMSAPAPASSSPPPLALAAAPPAPRGAGRGRLPPAAPSAPAPAPPPSAPAGIGVERDF